MKTYWDYSEKERAELTHEDVAKLIDFELMEKGVLKVAPLVLEGVTEPKLPTVEVFRVVIGTYDRVNVAFRRIEDAQTFIAMQPIMIAHDWETQREHMKSLDAPKIELVAAVDEHVIANHKNELKRIAAARAENERKSSAHRKAMEAVEQASKGVWDDWYEVIDRKRQAERIAATRVEYLRMTDGNAELADAFLAKAFDVEQRKSAAVFHDDIPF